MIEPSLQLYSLRLHLTEKWLKRIISVFVHVVAYFLQMHILMLPLILLKIFLGAIFILYLTMKSKEMDRRFREEREKGMTCSKGPRLESNPGRCNKDFSLDTGDACFTMWATGVPLLRAFVLLSVLFPTGQKATPHTLMIPVILFAYVVSSVSQTSNYKHKVLMMIADCLSTKLIITKLIIHLYISL